ncbi:MAG: MetQ/NlpA family ABC transporter substrate-binding protein [Bacilli bacterium]|jgi:D-methionine transport system substrate-binding protein|nr:MetQ/NlpA family ABC transporter substrate-binding protein [Bacilli bacterium]MCH4210548.1 MetQ/NlpA family ABC transporter substrate-binding protein [Bacilli bacterium]MCH4228809.1 MetQ/NlpA family ABC transporter substrate-binding protein [Bacilli bacterium]MCH4277394.1 MetQ/NlpA family ABC transporter substrate-binding protein [Bacilli bacterium]
MKKNLLFCLVALASVASLGACNNSSSTTISIAASEVPHAKILKECIKPILEEKGYSLEVTTLDWTLQNDAVANDEYDANYFQHVPYLKTYTGSTKLYAACKVHYEKLCLYASNKSNLTLKAGDSIEIVDDVSNIERALSLLASKNVLTINSSNYDADGNFTNFDTAHPTACVTFLSGYEGCSLTCIKEAQLCQSLADYDFGIIPGNTAMTGLGDDYASRIVFGEDASESLISEKANIVCVKESNKDSDKTKALVEACGDSRVKTYIESTYGESVVYHFENGLTTNFLDA